MSQPELFYVEQPVLDQLQKIGWSYKDGRELTTETSEIRSSLKEVVLIPNIEKAIKRINPLISEENLRKIILEITVIQTSTLIEANQWLWERLTQYFSVEQDLGKGRRGQTFKLIDFEKIDNNEFLCINQFKVKGPTQNIIPDIILFVNGLPLGVIECKSPYNVTDPMEAEIIKSTGEETFSDEIHQRILSLVKKLVNQFEESSKIVGFFLKQDEIKTMQRNIKRAMIEEEFDDPDLRKIVIERFMELAKVKFK